MQGWTPAIVIGGKHIYFQALLLIAVAGTLFWRILPTIWYKDPGAETSIKKLG